MAYRSTLLIIFVLISFFSYPSSAQLKESNTSDSLSSEKGKLLNGEVVVVLSDLPDGVTGVEGHIYIAAPPKKVWEVVTDYDNHKKFVPNVIDSGTISDNGSEKVIFEKGKSGMLFLKRRSTSK